MEKNSILRADVHLNGRDFKHVHALLMKGYTWASRAARIKTGNQVLQLCAENGEIYEVSNLSHDIDYFYFTRELYNLSIHKDVYMRNLSYDELQHLLGYEDRIRFERELMKVKKFKPYVLLLFQDKDNPIIQL